MKIKKTGLSLLAGLLALVFLIAGCQSGGGDTGAAPAPADSGSSSGSGDSGAAPATTDDAQPADTEGTAYICRYVVPGSEPDDSPMVDEAITAKLKADGINMDFERIYIPWDVWEQRTNVMLSSGEEFELLHIMEDWIPSSSYVARGGLAPITEYVEQYGDTLKAIIPGEVWDATRVDGDIYTIPVYFRDFSKTYGTSYIPTMLFEKYGLSLNPADPFEYLESLETIVKGEAAEADYRLMPRINTTYDEYILRMFDSYPIIVKEDMFLIDYDGNVQPWLYSDEFKGYVDFMNLAYKNGVIHPDVLTIPHELSSQQTELGNNLRADPYSVEQVQKIKPGWTLTEWVPYPEKPVTRGEWIYMNGNSVPVTSPNPEAGVIFFNWLYSAQENSDLLNYGIEGVHWADAGNRRYEPLGFKDDGTRLYSFGDWEMAHYQLVRISVNAPDALEAISLEMDQSALTAPSGGFSFDSSAVASEYTACMAEIQASVYPMKFGVVSYDDGYDRMIASMQAAGYDKVYEEFKAQFDAWLAAK